MNRILKPLLALFLLAPASLAQEPWEDLEAGHLKATMDKSLRWIRAQQREDGSYGGAARTTAWVLSAYAISPRAYRYGDGPFIDRAVEFLLTKQNDKGAFEDEGDNELYRRRTTSDAVLALLDLHAEHTKPARDRALKYLRAPEVRREDQVADYTVKKESVPRLQKRTWEVMQGQNEDGSFGEGDTILDDTAQGVLNLAYYHEMFLRIEPDDDEAPKPKQATPLPDVAATGESLAPEERARVQEAQKRGAAFLLTQAQDGLWGFGGSADPGISAMVVGALLAVPEPRGDEVEAVITRTLDWLVSLQNEDGSIHAGQLANYVTSASVLALAAAGRPADATVIERARAFLQNLQADEGEGYSESDRYYGGVGYGGDERPDLSNLQMALEALTTSGTEPGDESLQKALVFLQRCQNRSESNDLTFEREGTTYTSGEDGGSGYAPGESKAGFIALADGRKVPRSYGSMTYALLKSYLLAGLPKDDARVEAAWKWLRENYTLDVNPGFEASSDPAAAYQGLFYYFLTMARALDLYGEETVRDAQGGEHRWRTELAQRLLSMQRQDGSWINTNAPRWYEGNPVLATAYGLLTLEVVGAE